MFASRFIPESLSENEDSPMEDDRSISSTSGAASESSGDSSAVFSDEGSEVAESHRRKRKHSHTNSSDETDSELEDERDDFVLPLRTSSIPAQDLGNTPEFPARSTVTYETSEPRNDSNESRNGELYEKKHQSIFQKFKLSTNNSEKIIDKNDTSQDDIAMQDLAPLPQPKLPRDKMSNALSRFAKNLDWLVDPVYVSASNEVALESYSNKLAPFILKNVTRLGFKVLFSVQIAVLEIMLDDIIKNDIQPDRKGDILVNASTGSGKTLAYALPIIQGLYNRTVPRIRAIILVPTKPLVNQVKALMDELTKGSKLRVFGLTSSVSLNSEGQTLRNCTPDILISTPGRLVDHINNRTIGLEALKFLVLDEADRLLNQHFQNWCNILMDTIESNNKPGKNLYNSWRLQTQKLIFSATLTTDAGKLTPLNIYNPRLLMIHNPSESAGEIFTVPSTLKEYFIKFGSSKLSTKPLIMSKFLVSNNILKDILIFVRSNETSLRLAYLLQDLLNSLNPDKLVKVTYLNSTNNTPALRSEILKSFSEGSTNILVATDLIARGIDIASISYVVNYDLPQSSREYVHRVGRTARANNEGSAYTLCFGKGEYRWFQKLISNVGHGSKEVKDLSSEFNSEVSDAEEKQYQIALESLRAMAYKN